MSELITRKKDVVLFQIYSKSKNRKIAGLGVNYISAYLKSKGINSGVLNTLEYYVNRNPEGRILNKIKDLQPKIVGISSISFNNKALIQFCDLIKRESPNTFIVIGGYGPSHKKEMVSSPSVDILVYGEGEVPMGKLSERVLSGNPHNFADIRGIAYMDHGQMIVAPSEKLPPLDKLPFPDREVIDDSEIYRKNVVITSRGCPNNCSFCAIPKFYSSTKKWRERSIENIINELRSLKSRYGISSVEFFDDEFLIGDKRLEEIINGINEDSQVRDLRIAFAARSDNIVENEETIKMFKHKIYEVFCGIESFNEDYLFRINKAKDGSSALENNVKAVEILQKNGIRARYGFITPPDAQNKEFLYLHLPLRFSQRIDLRNFFDSVVSLNNYEIPFDAEEKDIRINLSPISSKYVQIMEEIRDNYLEGFKRLNASQLNTLFGHILNASEGNLEDYDQATRLLKSKNLKI